MTYLLLRTYLRRSARLLTISTLILLVALVDISRMVLEKHFLSDVLAGNALGLGILLLVIITWEWLPPSITHARS